MSRAVSEDIGIAKLYLSKMEQARSRGIVWGLTFNQYKQLRRRKTCYYTGLVLTNGVDKDPTSFTLDRIDSSKGYTVTNTVACSNLFNNFKNTFEHCDYKTLSMLVKGCNKFLSSVGNDYKENSTEGSKQG